MLAACTSLLGKIPGLQEGRDDTLRAIKVQPAGYHHQPTILVL